MPYYEDLDLRTRGLSTVNGEKCAFLDFPYQVRSLNVSAILKCRKRTQRNGMLGRHTVVQFWPWVLRLEQQLQLVKSQRRIHRSSWDSKVKVSWTGEKRPRTTPETTKQVKYFIVNTYSKIWPMNYYLGGFVEKPLFMASDRYRPPVTNYAPVSPLGRVGRLGWTFAPDEWELTLAIREKKC